MSELFGKEKMPNIFGDTKIPNDFGNKKMRRTQIASIFVATVLGFIFGMVVMSFLRPKVVLPPPQVELKVLPPVPVEPKCVPAQYRVARGDSLWKISQRTWGGRGSLWPVLFDANSDKIRNPHLIFAGQMIMIPCLQSLPPLVVGPRKKIGGKTGSKTIKSPVVLPKTGSIKTLPGDFRDATVPYDSCCAVASSGSKSLTMLSASSIDLEKQKKAQDDKKADNSG